MERTLQRAIPGTRISSFSCLEPAVAALERDGSDPFDLAVLDVVPDGLAFLGARARIAPRLPAVAVTGYGSDTLEKARAAGASLALSKPVRLAEIEEALCTLHVPTRLESPDAWPMIGASTAMTALREEIFRVRQGTGPVLILGETGTGKEVAARAVHRKGPFVAVNCSALDALFESRMFGHQRGAFTGADRDARGAFEQAAGGTLFLDEVAELAVRHQAMLLRPAEGQAFQPVGAERWVTANCRIIAATNATLSEHVSDGRFREDLFYRLGVHTIEVPPLRTHREDVPALVGHFMQQLPTPKHVSDQAMNLLSALTWPGNVRQLRNAVQHLAAHTTNDTVTADDVTRLSAARSKLAGATPVPTRSNEILVRIDGSYDKIIEAVSTAALQRFMADAGDNVSKAARNAGLDRNTLTRLLIKCGLR